jgi:hypothetical protein
VGARVADAGNLEQFVGDAGRDAGHFLNRGSRRRHPMHQEVALLELREELVTEKWPCDNTGKGHQRDCHIGGRRAPDDRLEQPLVARSQPIGEG